MFGLLSQDDFVLRPAGHALLLVDDHLVVVVPGGGVHYLHLELHPNWADPDIVILSSIAANKAHSRLNNAVTQGITHHKKPRRLTVQLSSTSPVSQYQQIFVCFIRALIISGGPHTCLVIPGRLREALYCTCTGVVMCNVICNAACNVAPPRPGQYTTATCRCYAGRCLMMGFSQKQVLIIVVSDVTGAQTFNPCHDKGRSYFYSTLWIHL